MKNTYSTGALHFYFFPSKRKTFIGACADLCIVEEGKDLELIKYHTFASAKGYLKVVCDEKLGEHLLNQELPEEIVEEFVEFVRKEKMRNIEETIITLQDLRDKSGENLVSHCD